MARLMIRPKKMSEDIIVALIGMIGVGLGVLITAYFSRRKTKSEANKIEAEANEQIRETVMSLITPLNARIGQLEARVKKLESRVNRYMRRILYLMEGIRMLLVQIEDAHLTPVWQPDEWNPDDEDCGQEKMK